MSVSRAWVFRCDFLDCREFSMCYTERVTDAIYAAAQAGWYVRGLTRNGEHRCPAHHPNKEIKLTQGGSDRIEDVSADEDLFDDIVGR